MNHTITRPQVLLIYGATGVGKSDFALEIARKVPAEIINMDIGSFYKPLTIGTAKPDWRNETIPHHMFDIIDAPENYTVVSYRAACLKLIDEIVARGNLPILVGGSGFYLKSLFFPPEQPITSSHIQNEKITGSVDELWNQLYVIDSIRALAIDRHDEYRIKRALEIWFKTGEKPSSYEPQFDFPFSSHVVYVYRDRQKLHTRINKRVLQMLNVGWIEEVQQLVGTPWEDFIRHKKIIGYNELLDYVRGSDNLDKITVTIQKRTRLYAKRQMTFWRMLQRLLSKEKEQSKEKSVDFGQVDLTLVDQDLYIKKLLSCIASGIKCVCFSTF